VSKKDKDPDVVRRRVLDHPRGSVVVDGKVCVYLPLNSRTDVANQAEVSFSNFDRIARRACHWLARSSQLNYSGLAERGAWYK
jgi:hypothetical protein